MNLASVCHAEDRPVLWHFISRYVPEATPANAPFLDKLVDYAIAYYKDFVKPQQTLPLPIGRDEAAALDELATELAALPAATDAEAIQTVVYEVGKRHPAFAELRAWFQALYEILLGQDQGPRMGSFIALYGPSPRPLP